jgi:2-keto-3-deoxy-L-rhamnonate aldolase RhmA
MNRRFSTAVFIGAVGVGLVLALAVTIGAVGGHAAQTTEDRQARPNAGGQQFPLAAPAGVDSNAINQAPPGAVNQGPLDPSTWKYGHAFDAPAGAKIWNPVMIKMMKGEKVIGGTVFYDDSPAAYCAMANSGYYDFIWTEMQHSPRDWEKVARMWAACPHAKAVPGVRVAYTNEREEQHAMDMGALVLVVPTVRSVQEGTEARNWAMFPPLGARSLGGGQAFSPEFWGQVPGGYRNTINQNVVLIEMIETVEGAKDAKKIAAIPGVTAVFAASSDLGNFSGYKQGDPDYERLINMVHDAAIDAHKRLCGPIAWVNRPDFTCFQASSETGAIDQGAGAGLEQFKNKQGKPEVGPYAEKQ